METLFNFDQVKKIEEYKNKGWEILGHFCSNTPEELFYCNKILPIRIFPLYSNNYILADKYFPSYTCSFARSSLNSLLEDRYEDFDCFFFSSNCETIRCLYYHFQKKYPGKFIPSPILPAKAYTHCSKKFLLNELNKLFKIICEYSKQSNSEGLGNTIDLFKENRSLMNRLINIKTKKPGLISVKMMNDTYYYNMWVDKETANKRLKEFIEKIQLQNIQIEDKPKVFIIGNCCGNNSILELIEDCGCYVVNDFISTGNKYFQDVDKVENPNEYVALRLAQGVKCPSRIVTYSNDRENNLNLIAEKIKGSNVDCIILVNQKFCDPHALDRPFLIPRLKELKIPFLEIESEQILSNSAQIINRVEAFFENI